MYTLEDDHDTSSRLPKRPETEAELQPGTFGDSEDASEPTQPAQADAPVATPLSRRQTFSQITSSLKKIATPTSSGNSRAAIAALTVACIAVFFTALDQTVVVTALPQMITTLQIPFTQLNRAAWIISAYLLGFVVAMPLMGRVSDIYGRRRIFLLCLSIFGVGSVLCALAPDLGQAIDLSFLQGVGIDTSSPGLVLLIAARFIQAIGGGAVVPVAMAIASDFYGQERRAVALGIIGAVTEAGGAVGPLYGAVVVARLGWQAIFWLNVPVVIALLVAACFLIPRGKRLRERIDWLGATLLALALTCLSLGLAQEGTSLGPVSTTQATPQNNPIALVLAVVFLVAFVLVERKVRWPVIELANFKRFAFSAASLVSLLVGAALIIAMTDIPIYVDTVLQGPVLESGLALLRLTVMIPLGALLGGWLCDRLSCRWIGMLGLLFTATGFFLMSRWPIHVGELQMTISTITAGFGFGLVIAPIGTTTINAVRPSQAGMGSAVVTALRMVGMTLGLAALTSWALAYFKQLAATYRSLPLSATAAQFSRWSKGYALHLIESEHTVYTTVFFISMLLCLLALVPAFFLWGKQAPLEEPVSAESSDGVSASDVTLAGWDDVEASQLPFPSEQADTTPRGKWWQEPRRRKRVLIFASIALVLLLISGGVLAAFMFGDDDSSTDSVGAPTTGHNVTSTPTATPVSGPRMMQLALDKDALTSVFASQLNLQGGVLTDLNVTPAASDGLVLTLNLNIDASGLHRVLPVELDGTLALDGQQNLILNVSHLKRDGLDAGPDAAASMQTAIDEMLSTSVMPALRNELKSAQLISVHTSTTIACGQGVEMLVLEIQAPAIQGIAAQPTPVPLCFKGPVDLNKLLPQ